MGVPGSRGRSARPKAGPMGVEASTWGKQQLRVSSVWNCLAEKQPSCPKSAPTIRHTHAPQILPHPVPKPSSVSSPSHLPWLLPVAQLTQGSSEEALGRARWLGARLSCSSAESHSGAGTAHAPRQQEPGEGEGSQDGYWMGSTGLGFPFWEGRGHRL